MTPTPVAQALEGVVDMSDEASEAAADYVGERDGEGNAVGLHELNEWLICLRPDDVASATQYAFDVLRHVAKGSQLTVAPTDSQGGDWFSEDPPKDSRFRFGPLEGSLKDLAAWIGVDTRTLRTHNGQTSWWVKKEHGKNSLAWLSTQGKFATANQKRLAESAQNDTK
jgi:hypothetical protein